MSYRTGATGLTRDLNRAAILRLIGLSGPIARTSIAKRLGLSPATVTSITRELIESGIVRTADRAPSRGGRPALLLEIVSRSAHAFGVKIAPDHLVGVVVDLDGEVSAQFEARLDLTAAHGFDAAVKVLRGWLDEASAETPLLGVGLGVPGVVDSASGRVTSPLIGWSDFALRDALQQELGIAVLVDNDVNTLATSERLYGRGRDVEDFITRHARPRRRARHRRERRHLPRARRGSGRVRARDGRRRRPACARAGSAAASRRSSATRRSSRSRAATGRSARATGSQRCAAQADAGDARRARDLRRGGDRARPGGRESRQRPEPEADPRQRRGNAGVGSL